MLVFQMIRQQGSCEIDGEEIEGIGNAAKHAPQQKDQ
jgi:hypothetical protein